MSVDEIVAAAENLESKEISDLAALVKTLPKQAIERILASLTTTQCQQLEQALSYPAGTVGSLMDFSVLTAYEDASVKDVLEYCQKLGTLPEHSHHVYILDGNNTLLGMLPLQQLITLSPEQKINEAMSLSMISFFPDDSAEQASFAFERYELIASPVIDENNRLVGRICIDDIVDFMRESSEQQMLRQIGFISGEDRLAGIWSGAKNRWLWLAINLFTAFTATRMITLFEDKIIELVMLATLMPIVSSTAGSIGNQTCTLMIRSLALGQVTDNNLRQFYLKEVSIGVINGLVCGGFMGIFVSHIYSAGIGTVMGAAMLFNFVLTSVVAVSIPVLRHKLDLDPAIGAHVIVTFLADSFGFFIFLGMASAFL